ncbi:MAG: DUF6010 family protein, partial [Burkholderiales bacterium]
GILILYSRWRAQGHAFTVFAAGLVVAALLYVGFALAGGAQPRSLLLEFAGAVAFALLAWLGLRRSPLWLALGWGAHVGWDLGLHVGSAAPAFVPAWYPVVCTSFDLLVAAYIVARSGAARARRSEAA